MKLVTFKKNNEQKLGALSGDGIVDLNAQDNELYMITLTATSVEIPTEFVLKPAFPNPFNPVTNIEYGLPSDSYVSISIYDVNGRQVTELVN